MDEVKIGEILQPVGGSEGRRREETVRRKFWRTLRRAAGQIPFAEDLVAGFYCAIDPDTPPRVRGILFAALAYFVMPVDIVPDFLAGFGFTDDVTVLLTALTAVKAHIRPAHRLAARNALMTNEKQRA
ncbi:YkvA family protein [Chelativorans composti]|jgi:Uncharacterized conserved protein|uniref:YkvA family protein n=1 Tax=Chelativorans composti TaxID=768533 RepID=A0ABW5DFU9_9HYPH